MQKRLLVIMNPSAYDWEAKKRWPRMEPRLRQAAEITLVETVPDKAETISLVREALAGRFDRVVAIGGDGTIHMVVNAIMTAGLDPLPELAVIPFGTANNVAKSLGLPVSDLDRLAAIAAGSQVGLLDVPRLRMTLEGATVSYIWINCVSVGMDADVVVSRSQYRQMGSYLSYVAALAERSLPQRSLDVRLGVDGANYDLRLFNIIVNNVPIYAGAMEMPGCRPDDGLLDVYLFNRVEYGSKVLSYMIKRVDVFNVGLSEGLESITENQRELHGRRIHLRLASPRDVQVDGEAFGKAQELELDIAGQLRVAVP